MLTNARAEGDPCLNAPAQRFKVNPVQIQTAWRMMSVGKRSRVKGTVRVPARYTENAIETRGVPSNALIGDGFGLFDSRLTSALGHKRA
jgi:hypothetical protein